MKFGPQIPSLQKRIAARTSLVRTGVQCAGWRAARLGSEPAWAQIMKDDVLVTIQHETNGKLGQTGFVFTKISALS